MVSQGHLWFLQLFSLSSNYFGRAVVKFCIKNTQLDNNLKYSVENCLFFFFYPYFFLFLVKVKLGWASHKSDWNLIYQIDSLLKLTCQSIAKIFLRLSMIFLNAELSMTNNFCCFCNELWIHTDRYKNTPQFANFVMIMNV